MDKGFAKFIAYERQSRDTIDVKRLYIDMADDLSAGILLSQIVFWYLPTKDGSDKLRIEHDEEQWIANTRDDWWDQVRLKPRQFDRAAGILETKGLITKGLYKFKGSPTVHVRLNIKGFLESLNGVIVKSISPIRNMELTNPLNGSHESVKSSISEKTTKITTESGAIAPVNGSHLIKAYMEKQLEDEIVDKIDDARPSDAEMGMLKNLAKRGVTPEELKNLVDVGWDEKKYSIDHISRDLATLRAKVAEIKPSRKESPKTIYTSKCETCKYEETHTERKGEWCPFCSKRCKFYDESGKVVPRYDK